MATQDMGRRGQDTDGEGIRQPPGSARGGGQLQDGRRAVRAPAITDSNLFAMPRSVNDVALTTARVLHAKYEIETPSTHDSASIASAAGLHVTLRSVEASFVAAAMSN